VDRDLDISILTKIVKLLFVIGEPRRGTINCEHNDNLVSDCHCDLASRFAFSEQVLLRELSILIGVHPSVRRDLAPFCQFDHMHGGSVAALAAGPAFERRSIPTGDKASEPNMNQQRFVDHEVPLRLAARVAKVDVQPPSLRQSLPSDLRNLRTCPPLVLRRQICRS
jgi:hypothetical protein